jgi:hypothetical protein
VGAGFYACSSQVGRCVGEGTGQCGYYGRRLDGLTTSAAQSAQEQKENTMAQDKKAPSNLTSYPLTAQEFLDESFEWQDCDDCNKGAEIMMSGWKMVNGFLPVKI